MAEDNQDDWLSKLPDKVLLNIVERLGIADAARTSVLSRRWKQIPAMPSKIVITVDSFERKHEHGKITSDDDDMVRANTTVLEATRSILKRRDESLCTIHLLSIRFYLGDESIFIGHAVANTIATQKVASVEFSILTKVRRKCTNNDMLTYGRQFMSFFDSCPNTFGGLARLTLENLRLRESDFPKFFSICKQLEFLSIYRCDMGIMSLLEVEHPQLRELVIAGTSLMRVDLKWRVSIINMGPSWQKMLNLSELLGKTAISNLHLDFKCEKIWVKPEGQRQLLPVFHKLKVVNLIYISEECDLTWTMFILQGAPVLKELGIMVLNHWCGMILGKRRKMYSFSEDKDKDKDSSGNHLHLISNTRVWLSSESVAGLKEKKKWLAMPGMSWKQR